MERLLPPTIDERIAEDENSLLDENETAMIRGEDDHNVHLEIHAKAKDTPAAKVHIESHKRALSIKKLNPEFFPQDPNAAAFQPPGTKTMSTPTLPGAPRPVAPSQSSN